VYYKGRAYRTAAPTRSAEEEERERREREMREKIAERHKRACQLSAMRASGGHDGYKDLRIQDKLLRWDTKTLAAVFGPPRHTYEAVQRRDTFLVEITPRGRRPEWWATRVA
jgi:hypothetical protein